MSEIPEELKYTESHEWVRIDGDAATIGITDHAQAQLGDIVYVELPDVGSKCSSKHEIAVVESTKAAAEVYSPVSGIVTEVNEALEEHPELVNSDAEEIGWLFKLKITNPDELEQLMSHEEYLKTID